MEYLLIGLIVGLTMGLTGSGGALVSIPLFIFLLNTTLKEATVLSLMAVIFGTGVNLLGMRVKPDKKIVSIFTFFGVLTNYATLRFKTILPDIYIVILLTLIGSYSLWTVWRPNKREDTSQRPKPIILTAIIGTGIGFITTLTGLGGGVIIIPILLQIYGLKYEQALPTSLVTIFLISTIAFVTQFKTGIPTIAIKEVILLVMGSLGPIFFFSNYWV